MRSITWGAAHCSPIVPFDVDLSNSGRERTGRVDGSPALPARSSVVRRRRHVARGLCVEPDECCPCSRPWPSRIMLTWRPSRPVPPNRPVALRSPGRAAARSASASTLLRLYFVSVLPVKKNFSTSEMPTTSRGSRPGPMTTLDGRPARCKRPQRVSMHESGSAGGGAHEAPRLREIQPSRIVPRIGHALTYCHTTPRRAAPSAAEPPWATAVRTTFFLRPRTT